MFENHFHNFVLYKAVLYLVPVTPSCLKVEVTSKVLAFILTTVNITEGFPQGRRITTLWRMDGRKARWEGGVETAIRRLL